MCPSAKPHGVASSKTVSAIGSSTLYFGNPGQVIIVSVECTVRLNHDSSQTWLKLSIPCAVMRLSLSSYCSSMNGMYVTRSAARSSSLTIWGHLHHLMEILPLQAIHSIGHKTSQGGHVRGMVLLTYDVLLRYLQRCHCPGREGVRQGVGAGDGGEGKGQGKGKVHFRTVHEGPEGGGGIAVLFP
jgi:hypothetical protein